MKETEGKVVEEARALVAGTGIVSAGWGAGTGTMVAEVVAVAGLVVRVGTRVTGVEAVAGARVPVLA